MKFLTYIALIGGAAAIRLTSQTRGEPSAHDIIKMCDQDGSGGLTPAEAHACVDKFAPAGKKAQFHKQIDEDFKHVDADGNGEVDENEMKNAKLAQKKGPSAKQIIEHCDADKSGGLTKDEAHKCIDDNIKDKEQNEQAHKMVDEGFEDADKNGDGEVDRKELRKAMKAHKKANKLSQGPPAKQIMKWCDADKDQMLTLEEVKDCILKHAPADKKEEILKEAEEQFKYADKNGDGKVEMKELEEAVKAHKLAQKGPSAKQIIDMCDADKSGGLTPAEAHACIDANIKDEKDNKEAHEMVDEGFEHVDKNGDGEVDKKELRQAMKAHKKL